MAERAVVRRARQDLEDGRAWKARDRLLGALAQTPGDQDVLTLLGRVQYDLGDLPAAGRAWVCTDAEGPDVDHALGEQRARWGGSSYELWRSLPLHVHWSALPDVGGRRLQSLWREARAEAKRRGIPLARPERPEREDTSSWWDWAVPVGVIAGFAFVLACFVTGLVQIVGMVVDALGG